MTEKVVEFARLYSLPTTSIFIIIDMKIVKGIVDYVKLRWSPFNARGSAPNVHISIVFKSMLFMKSNFIYFIHKLSRKRESESEKEREMELYM